MLWYIFPVKDGISWEGHLGGFLTGFALAFFMKTKMPSSKKFDWEHEDYNEENDEFLKQFDEKGNFIEIEKEELPADTEPINIKYHFRKDRDSNSEF
jgi:hypothetical protein